MNQPARVRPQSINMHTFTIIANYKGVSAISQHQGHSPVEALKNWLKTFSFRLFNLSKRQVAALRSDSSVGPVKRMDDFKSMWFVWSALGKRKPILDGGFSIHILDTRLE